mgnify:CR=1 FL=1
MYKWYKTEDTTYMVLMGGGIYAIGVLFFNTFPAVTSLEGVHWNNR